MLLQQDFYVLINFINKVYRIISTLRIPIKSESWENYLGVKLFQDILG